jgi:protein-S-isoprenylcysteine O-methyltransferase Ste14
MATLTATGLGLFAALLFAPAGRLDWISGWLYLGLVTTNFAINYVYLQRNNPELIVHRMHIGKGTRSWDKVWLSLFTPVFLSIYAVAGLDAVRYGWSAMPEWLWLSGLVLFLPGAVLFGWAMGVNPFFEKTVRIQRERGHHVIDSGPYRLVRHPGYPCCWARGGPLCQPCCQLPALLCGQHWRTAPCSGHWTAMSNMPAVSGSG